MSSRSIRDERWFEALFRTHHGAVLAYAARRVDDPDDVVSEVFAAAWRNRVKVPDTPLPWLLRTAGNVVLHAQRSHGRRLRLLTRTASLAGPESVGPTVEGFDDSSRVGVALGRLSPDDQGILRLVAWEDLGHDELARVLGCSVGTARVRLHRARRRFEDQLDRPVEPPAPTTRQETRP